MKIIVVPDDGSFFAQGIDEDYGAQGESVDDAASNFKIGMSQTIELRRDHNRPIFVGAPPQVTINEFLGIDGAIEMDVEIEGMYPNESVAS